MRRDPRREPVEQRAWSGDDDRDEGFEPEDVCQWCGRIFFRADLDADGVCVSCLEPPMEDES